MGTAGPPAKAPRRDLHLLRAQLRNLRCVNGPHGVLGACYVPPGLQMACQTLNVVQQPGAAAQERPRRHSVQAERWHAIKQSSAETQVTLQRIGELRGGHQEKS